MNTIQKEKVLLFWSGGKDSMLALHYIKQNPKLELVGLVVTINQETNTVPFHGVPDCLLIEQAKLLKLPLQRIFIPPQCTNEIYISRVRDLLSMFSKRGIKTVAFGDVHQDEIKKFREDMLLPLEMQAIFPLWGRSSKEIVNEFLELGHKALVTSIDQTKLDKSFLNCEFNQEFIQRLPSEIDPAGENGEYHTFVIYGPGFKSRVAFSKSIAIIEGPYLVSLLKEP